MPSVLNFLAAFDQQWLMDHLLLLIGIAVVVLGLGIFGIPDLLRFSIKRVWAISSVCYQESIRRRVLWIIPLAIVGLVIVVQLQLPIDEQDAIRQTTKFCLFATGLVVVVSTIILACTNLPREIENRVIFTVVSKPTTRLEIILGKIVGFARVSATILVIMGLFSYGYLNVRAWGLQRDLRERLSLNAVEPLSRPTYQHYVEAGLLNAKRLALSDPMKMNIYGELPRPGSPRRYPTADGTILIPFHLPPDMWATADPEGSQHPGLELPGIIINVRMGYDPLPPPTKPARFAPSGPPKVGISIMDPNINTVLSSEVKGSPAIIPAADGSKTIQVVIGSTATNLLTKYPYFFVCIGGAGGDGRIWIDENPDPQKQAVTLSVPEVSGPLDPPYSLVLPSDPQDKSKPSGYVFVGRDGVIGQQVKGDSSGSSQVCVFDFNNLKLNRGSAGLVPVEFRVGVEKSGDIKSEDTSTDATLTVINSKTGAVSEPIKVAPENNRPFYTNLPADALANGDFQVVVRCLSDDQWLNLKRSSLAIVQSEDSFAFNLLKSTLVLWFLSILVTSISVFCSTFLSWPIAVVLTLVMLLGRWGVNQLGDAATAGIGRQIATDFKVVDPTQAQLLSGTVEELNKGMKAVATVLPDIEQFAVTDNIDRGITIPIQTLIDAVVVLLGFGVPMTVLAFVIFKNKEVAP